MKSCPTCGRRVCWSGPACREGRNGLAGVDLTGPETVSSAQPAVEKSQSATVRRPDSNPKSAYGVRKPPLHLIPQAALAHEALAMAEGARKYGAYNWREQPVAATVYVSAAMRHLAAYLDGEDTDPSSGVHHLAHARACLGILFDCLELGTLIDDRPLPGPAADTIRRLTRE